MFSTYKTGEVIHFFSQVEYPGYRRPLTSYSGDVSIYKGRVVVWVNGSSWSHLQEADFGHQQMTDDDLINFAVAVVADTSARYHLNNDFDGADEKPESNLGGSSVVFDVEAGSWLEALEAAQARATLLGWSDLNSISQVLPHRSEELWRVYAKARTNGLAPFSVRYPFGGTEFIKE